MVKTIFFLFSPFPIYVYYIDIYELSVKSCHFIFAKMRQNALLFPALFNFNDVLPHFLFLRTKPKADENLRTLHDHPVKTGQCNIFLYCAPSCLPRPRSGPGPAGRDPRASRYRRDGARSGHAGKGSSFPSIFR
jgi:hypothetical protein